MWYAAVNGHPAHGVSARVMNYFCHMNSKTMFRYMLNDNELMRRHRPVSIHINYHPEKLPRMEDVFERYLGVGADVNLGNGDGRPTKRSAQGGLHAWHWGVGLKAGKACREATRRRGGDGSALADRVRRAGGDALWAGIKGLKFVDGGTLQTPWGPGAWGRLGDGKEDTLFADFIGQQHLVRLHPVEGWPKLQSMRCADFENVTVTVVGG